MASQLFTGHHDPPAPEAHAFQAWVFSCAPPVSGRPAGAPCKKTFCVQSSKFKVQTNPAPPIPPTPSPQPLSPINHFFLTTIDANIHPPTNTINPIHNQNAMSIDPLIG